MSTDTAEPAIKYEFGDLYMEDEGDLGLSFFRKAKSDGTPAKKLTYLNQASELALLEYLKDKYPKGSASDNVLLGLKNGTFLHAAGS